MRVELTIERASDVERTPRVQQLLGIFDVPPAKRSMQTWHHAFDLPNDYSVGVIVGPSGAGKTTLAREMFGDRIVGAWPWPERKSVLDGFPASVGIKDIAGLLSSVGFSSPPAWVKPFGVLSNGEQFRVHLARTLAEQPELAVVDEFTSVVDRQVAQIGSAAVAKAVRARGQKFVAVTCHYDVLDWLAPDWVYEPHAGKLEVADAASESVRRRPAIDLEIIRCNTSAWERFKPHHYLSGDIHKGAACYMGLINGEPAAFTAVLSFPHPNVPGWREHRTVCLPDFQGVGIGNAMSAFVASLYVATGKPYTSSTSHPSMIKHRSRSPLWRCVRKPGFNSRPGSGNTGLEKTVALDRLTASFRYIGPARPAEAAAFGIGAARPTPPSREDAALLRRCRRALRKAA